MDKMKTPINSTIDWIEIFKTVNGKYPTGEEITSQLVMQLPIEREAIEQATKKGVLFGYNTFEQPLSANSKEARANGYGKSYYETTYKND